ncbi:hypothetical protein OIE43_43415 [Streptomyces pseudovenezuelae]|uniref:hypothetical protein n=1 Tax=Streptomyces pseudovenezuelae TaxID=67350 RepID=UPI002E3634FE|nr:hypothetical protein [Streptomyces pseudovenezuelae]
MPHIDESVVESGPALAVRTLNPLQRRVRALEERVDTLTVAVQALVEGLERAPGQAGGGGRASHGAGLAHDILKSRRP